MVKAGIDYRRLYMQKKIYTLIFMVLLIYLRAFCGDDGDSMKFMRDALLGVTKNDHSFCTMYNECSDVIALCAAHYFAGPGMIESYKGHMAIESYKNEYRGLFVQNAGGDVQDVIGKLYNYAQQGSPKFINILYYVEKTYPLLKKDIKYAVVGHDRLLSQPQPDSKKLKAMPLSLLVEKLAVESAYIYNKYKKYNKNNLEYSKRKKNQSYCIAGGVFAGFCAGGILSHFFAESKLVVGLSAAVGGVICAKAISLGFQGKNTDDKKMRLKEIANNYLKNAHALNGQALSVLRWEPVFDMRQGIDEYRPRLAGVLVDKENNLIGFSEIKLKYGWDGGVDSVCPTVCCENSGEPVYAYIKNRRLFVPHRQHVTSSLALRDGIDLNDGERADELIRVDGDNLLENKLVLPEGEVCSNVASFEDIDDVIRRGGNLGHLPDKLFVRLPLYDKKDQFVLERNPIKIVSSLKTTIVIAGIASFEILKTNENHFNNNPWEELDLSDYYKQDPEKYNCYLKDFGQTRIYLRQKKFVFDAKPAK